MAVQDLYRYHFVLFVFHNLQGVVSMKVSDYIKYIDKEVGYKCNGLVFKVVIKDVKTGYNSVFMQIVPVDPGQDSSLKGIWVGENSISFV